MKEVKIHVEDWLQVYDGKWYIVIPFEATEDEDVVIDFIDSPEYMQEHMFVYDYIESGYTSDNQVVIIASNRPVCPITLGISKSDYHSEKIDYDKFKFYPGEEVIDLDGINGIVKEVYENSEGIRYLVDFEGEVLRECSEEQLHEA